MYINHEEPSPGNNRGGVGAGFGRKLLALALAGWGGCAGAAWGHPLATMERVLPLEAGPIQVVDWQGAALVATGDPQGAVLRERADGGLEPLDTGLPGISRLHHSDGVWLAMADGKWWRATAWPLWHEMSEPVPGEGGTVAVVNDEFWLWTWGGLRWHGGGQATRIQPRLFRSADGLMWTEVFPTPEPQPMAMSYAGLAWADGRFVLAGDAYQMVAGFFQHAGGLWTSEDGTTWQRQTAVDGTYTSVAHGDAGWLAGGSGQFYAVSADGVAWSRRNHEFVNHWLTNGFNISPMHSSLRSVVWLPSGYHALASVNGSPFVVVSADGIHWRRGVNLKSGDFPGNPTLATAADRIWLAGSGENLWNAEDWRWGAARVLPIEPSDWQVVMASPTRAVVLGDEGRAGWSDDGADWQFVPLPGSGAMPVAGVWAADRNEFLAVGLDADASAFRIWRSADGITWGSRMVHGQQPVGVARGAGRYVVALAEGWILHSEDGLDWQYGRLGGGAGFPERVAPQGLQGLASDGHTFAALTTRGGVAVSGDGASWDLRAGPVEFPDAREARLCGDGGLWLFKTSWHTYASSDLVEWHLAGHGVRRAVHAFGEFVGIDGNSLRTSRDGLVWAARGTGVGVKHLAPFQNRLLGVGDNGLILRSGPWSDFYETWRQVRFSPAQLADPAISGDARDPDADGLANVLEYALGLDPLTPDSAAAVRISRVLSHATGDPAVPVLRLEFPSWDESPGVRVWAEHSTDLRNWSRAGWRAGKAYGPGGTVRKINGREIWTREIDASGPQRFLRLRGERITSD